MERSLQYSKPLEAILKKEITKVTSRLQRMILKLIKYDFKVTYTPGKHMYVADTLSRAYLKDPVSDDPELESVVHSVSKHLAVTPEKREVFQEETKEDKVSKLIMKYHFNGWPDSKKTLEEEIKEYWKYKNDVDIH